MRPQPLIAVRDVPASGRWYQHLSSTWNHRSTPLPPGRAGSPRCGWSCAAARDPDGYVVVLAGPPGA